MKQPFKLTKRTDNSDETAPAQEAPRPKFYAGYRESRVGNKSGMHLRDYWRAVRKYQWMILALAVVTALAVAVYMARQPDIYQAKARVQVDLENTLSALAGGKGNSPLVANTVNDPTYFSTQLQVLSSSSLLRRVVKALDLERDQDFLQPQKAALSGSLWQKLRGAVSKPEAVTNETNGGKKATVVPLIPPEMAQTIPAELAAVKPEDMEEVRRLAPYVTLLQRNLMIEPVKDLRLQVKETRLIDVHYTHPDPQVSAKIVNALVNAFATNNLERQTGANSTAGEFLQKRIAELQTQIRDGEERLNSYSKGHEIISLDANKNTVIDRLAGLNRQLLDAENERKAAEAALQAAQAPGAAEALAEGNSAQIAATEAKLAELRQKREQMLVESTEQWVEVREVAKQIAELERQIKEARARAVNIVVKNLETRYQQARAREQSLQTAYGQQRADSFAQNDAAINYRIINQEIETNRSLLEGLLQRSKENNVLLAALVGTPNNIHVTDYALVPAMPIGPKRMESVALSFLCALAAGIGMALFLSYMDDSINTTSDVERMLHLPALALIPAVGNFGRKTLLGLPGANLFTRRLENNGNPARPLLLNEVRPQLAESYRQLRTSVLMSTAGGAPRSLLITSSSQAEGKTTTTVNTAFVLAQTGASVLVIDADMRKPSLHAIFGMPRGNGLSTILSSEMEEDEMLKLVKQHADSKLYVLPAGPIPPNPAELLGSEQMRNFLQTCEEHFTYVLIDSPPVAMFTDGVLISSLVDGVLLVVNSGKSSREVVRLACKALQDVRAKIFGVVLNNMRMKMDTEYYTAGYKLEA
ncbi:MAG: polysaccharide biosynthesis tyrosine autokinase [Blastocatellia bacterium]